MSTGAISALLWIALGAYALRTARKLENERTQGHRPKRDSLKLLLAVAMISPAVYLFLTFGIGFISDHTPYFHGVNISAAVVAILGVYGLFVLALAVSRRSQKQPIGHLLRDSGTLFGAALGIIVVAMMAFMYADLRNAAYGINNRWFAIIFSAACVFGLPLKNFRNHWKRPRFWVLYLAFLGAHFAVLSFVFPAQEEVPFLLSLPLSLGEIFVLIVLFGILGFPPRPWRPNNEAAEPPSL